MKKIFFLTFLGLLYCVDAFAGGACTPATTNGSCATATSLTLNATCIDGTTCQGTGQSATPCYSGYPECSWYSFTAAASDMYVFIQVLSTDGCHIGSSVFSGSCGSLTSISCESGAPLDDFHSLTGLTVGNTYYIQVCYAPGGPCGNGGKATYCISAGVPDPPCDVCATPCGTAQGFASDPTVQEVVDNCLTSYFSPPLQSSQTYTFCYSFTAVNTSVDFNVVITSNCGGGNVTNFSWALYNITCGASIQTGDLSNLTFSGLNIGSEYVFCYTFTVPSTCTHSRHCPYFVGAAPVPIQLLSFMGFAENDINRLIWTTASETNNDFFTIEKSKDGIHFDNFKIVNGAGNSNERITYEETDISPYPGITYYRLKQTDYDGSYTYSKILKIENQNIEEFIIIPNPANKEAGFMLHNLKTKEDISIIIVDISGKVIYSNTFYNESESFSINNNFASGIYMIKTITNQTIVTKKLIIQ